MKKIQRLLFTMTCLMLASLAQAEVYKCTDTAGEVVFQGEPCRSGNEEKVDMRFGEQTTQNVESLVAGTWCEVGKSKVLDGTLQQDNALRKTWTFTESEMVQHINQGQRSDTFTYAIRQHPGSFVIDHPTFGSGQVNWQVKKLTDKQLVLSAYGDFTHLKAGECEMIMASSK